MNIYKVIDICEQDFGCEELPENQDYCVDVQLENCKNHKEITISLPDSLLYKNNINVGSSVSYDGKHIILLK